MGLEMLTSLTTRIAGLAAAVLILLLPPRAAWSQTSPPQPNRSAPAIERHVFGGTGGWDLVTFDAGTRVEKRWTLKPCEEPTVCANHTMAIVDALSGRVVAHLPIGAEPDGVEFDPCLAGLSAPTVTGQLLSSKQKMPNISASSPRSLPSPRARTLAWDPGSHLLYLVTASFGPAPAATAEQPRPRAPMTKDSFTLLVVNPN